MNQYVTGAVIKELREKTDSITELISGNTVCNSNISANMLKSKFYVCPVCGNAEARFKINGVRRILFYCNRDGLYYIEPVKCDN